MSLAQDLANVPTPALVLDRKILQSNLENMSGRMTRLGVNLRPHLKTAKCARVARLATQGHSGGITVSTLREADYFIKHGFRDLTYAITVNTEKLDRVAALQRNGAEIGVLTDNLEVARAIGQKAAQLQTHFRVFIEIDAGYHRSGVNPDSDLLTAIGQTLHEAEGVEMAGVLTHAGQSYKGANLERIREVAEQERSEMVRAAENLRAAAVPCPVVSVGSTPTASTANDLSGVNEARPGNYMFHDLTMCGLGICRLEEIAVFVLTSVISHKPEFGHALVDAGALALSRDLSAHNGPMPGVGYGMVCDLESRQPLEELSITDVCQEQGWLASRSKLSLPWQQIPIGTKLAILPNHSCLTCAAHDSYWIVDGGTKVEDVWERVNGW